jgi:hypothetical protein
MFPYISDKRHTEEGFDIKSKSIKTFYQHNARKGLQYNKKKNNFLMMFIMVSRYKTKAEENNSPVDVLLIIFAVLCCSREL